MPRRAQTREDLKTRLANLANWQTATRNDGGVAWKLVETRQMDRVVALDEAAFFDELFHYLQEIGAWHLLVGLDPGTREKPSYEFLKFTLFTLMRCVGGVQSMLATRDLLLTDESLMGVLGFNAYQVIHGCNGRGLDRQTNPLEVRGPFSYETVADNIVMIGADKLADMLNGLIRCLAGRGLFAKNLDVVLDATDDEATPTYKTDDGRPVPRVTREKRPDVRANRHAKKIEVTVYGWKIWVVWEPAARVPLAIAIDGINEPDNKHALRVLRQAKFNVKKHATIRSVTLDRGFLDGKLLWAIEKEIGRIYIPAKSNMTISTDARALAREAAAATARGRTLEGCTFRERHEQVTVGAGRNAKKKTLTTALVGIKEIACDWWNEKGSEDSKKHSKSFQPKLLNAVVVLRWDGAPADAEKEVVLLTTDPAEDPFVAFEAYDDRSLIENGCNREAKEHWFLEHHPKRTEAGVRTQAFFVFFCMALIAGFRAHKAQTDEAERRGQDTGISRYRRQLELKNRDKVVVFIDAEFGIFRNWEFALLCGVGVRERNLMGESVQTVLRRYGAPVPDSS